MKSERELWLEKRVEELERERDPEKLEAWGHGLTLRAETAEAKLAEAQRNCAILPAVVERKAVLEAEVERLREALERIDAEAGCPAAEYVPALPRIWEIARAAMRGGGE